MFRTLSVALLAFQLLLFFIFFIRHFIKKNRSAKAHKNDSNEREPPFLDGGAIVKLNYRSPSPCPIPPQCPPLQMYIFRVADPHTKQYADLTGFVPFSFSVPPHKCGNFIQYLLPIYITRQPRKFKLYFVFDDNLIVTFFA